MSPWPGILWISFQTRCECAPARRSSQPLSPMITVREMRRRFEALPHEGEIYREWKKTKRRGRKSAISLPRPM